jgi:hypothetical protein
MDFKPVEPNHLKNMAILLAHDPIRNLDFVTSTLIYLWAWSEGKVESSPTGPIWHDDSAWELWIKYGGKEY